MQIIAIYVFRDGEAADHAIEQLWRNLNGGFEKSAGEIWINSSISNPHLAGQICASLGGIAK